MSDPSSATQLVYAALEAVILSGRLKPRERLVERTLEKQLGVSRTPIREALRQLQYAGMVQADGARGVMVRDVDVREVFDLFTVRLPLEKLAIDLTGPLTEAQHARLDKILQELDQAFEQRDFPRMVALNSRFHEAVTNLTGNEWLAQTLEQVRRQCYLVVQHGPVAERSGQKVSLADHWQMLDLLVKRKTADVTALTFEHVLRGAVFFLRRSTAFDSTADARAAALQAFALQLRASPALEMPSIPAVISTSTSRPLARASALAARGAAAGRPVG